MLLLLHKQCASRATDYFTWIGITEHVAESMVYKH
jgi:hypothetical protein